MSAIKEPVLVDMAGLVAVALRRDKNTPDAERWTFGERIGQPPQHYLELAGRGQWSRHVPTIHLEAELGARIKAAWKQNEFGRFIGAKTLGGIIKALGEDITPQIKAERARRAEEAHAAEMTALSMKLAVGLRHAIDALVAYEAAVVGIQRSPERIADLRALLDEHTHEDAKVAEAVAYSSSMFGSYTPRSDD